MDGDRCGRLGRLHVLLNKTAATAVTSYGLQGRLIQSNSGWILLEVPNSLVRGAFDALHEPGAQLPTKDTDDPKSTLRAHISVMRPEELASIGNPRLSELGHHFSYTLGPLKTCVPSGWNDVARVWFIEVQSPALKQLRRSYGLTSLPNKDKFQFHVTVAIRKKNALSTNTVAKAASWLHELPDCPDLSLNTWRQLPQKVAAEAVKLFPLASAVREMNTSNLTAGDCIFWQPEQQYFRVWSKQANWSPVPGSLRDPLVRNSPWLVSDEFPADPENYRLIKIAEGYLEPAAKAWQAAATPLGGTHPLATMLLGGLLTGGVGYAGGKALDYMLPEEYFEKGVAPRNLALLGGILGAMPGAAYGAMQYRTNPQTGKPFSASGAGWLSTYPWNKKASATGEMMTRSIPVDAFNRAIWNDVSAAPNPFGTKNWWDDNSQPLRTTAPTAAAASGLISGTAALLNNATHISPMDVALTAANTGLRGWTYGMTAGKVLGALAGLKPESQQRLQQAGLWGGLLTGTVRALFGG